MSERRSWRDLAIFGGTPLFREPLHVNKPNLASRERLIELIDGMLDRRWFSNGTIVREFEERVAARTGVRHCIATCNATVALEIAVRALNLSGEIIIPSFTFAATAQALRWIGLTPVFCDVDPETHNIDPNDVEKRITPATRAIIGVHLWGQPCDIERLSDIAKRRRLTLLFDAAHALGSLYKDSPVGSFGAAEVFSFQATKFVTTGEGGAVTTNDSALAARLRSARNFGFDDGGVTELGTNGKLSEICAAMGLTYLDRFEEFLAANQATYQCYRTGLAGIPGLSVFDLDRAGKSNHQYVVVTVDESIAGVSRDNLLRILQAENIFAKRYFHPGCHRLMTTFPEPQLPATERLVKSVLVLPGGASITSEEIEGVCETLRRVVLHAEELRNVAF